MVYKRYSWKEGRSSRGVSPEVVGAVFEAIEARDGALTKEAFLEESRPENSPTHKCFEWDDNVAAEKYRLTQSRMIINDIVVTVVKADGEKTKAPAYVNVTVRKEKAQYKSLHIAMQNENEREIVLKNALEEVRNFEKKYSMYKELYIVFEAIRSVEREVGDRRMGG